MNLLEAVDKRRKEIAAAHNKAAECERTKCEEFKAAMVERLESQYDLELPSDYVGLWKVYCIRSDYGDAFNIWIPAGHEKASINGHELPLGLIEVGPDGGDIPWIAVYRCGDKEETFSTYNFIDAATFALTGERL